MLIPHELSALSVQLGEVLLERHWLCAVAESCTGGGLAAVITDTPGSSQWFDRGFVTYSNQAKQDMLGVPERMLLTQGAVSEETAIAMAQGVISASHAQLSVSITGIAGPDGGSIEKPVGTVWVAWACTEGPIRSTCYLLQGSRAQIRGQAIHMALSGLIDYARR